MLRCIIAAFCSCCGFYFHFKECKKLICTYFNINTKQFRWEKTANDIWTHSLIFTIISGTGSCKRRWLLWNLFQWKKTLLYWPSVYLHLFVMENSNACINLFISFYLFGYIFRFILKEIRPRTLKLAPLICLNIVEYVTESSNSANGFMLISCLKLIMTSFSNWIWIYDVINSVIMNEIQLLC